MTAGPHVIHIGLHKTGSTWLQRSVFPLLDDPSYNEHRRVLAALTLNLIAAEDDAFLGDSFRDLVEQCERRGVRLLISNEGLSGNLWGERASSRAAQRLASVAPNARIVMLVRRQAEMIAALYAQHVNEGGYVSFRNFLSGEFNGPAFDFESLEYDRLASLYVERFGRSNLMVLPYERLRGSPEAALGELFRFLETEPPSGIEHGRVNASLSPLGMVAMRAWNRAFRVSPFNPTPSVRALGQGMRVRRFLQERLDPLVRRLVPPAPPRQRRALDEWGLDRYADSNARLTELCGVPLHEHGYPLPAGPGRALVNPRQ